MATKDITMSVYREVLAADASFFEALSERDPDALDRLINEDFLLIDVLTGSEVPRSVFVELVGSQRLIFDTIDRFDTRERVYGDAAIVTGRTRMAGHYEAQSFQVHSRYTHLFIHGREGWRLVSAQGTPVVENEPG